MAKPTKIKRLKDAERILNMIQASDADECEVVQLSEIMHDCIGEKETIRTAIRSYFKEHHDFVYAEDGNCV